MTNAKDSSKEHDDEANEMARVAPGATMPSTGSTAASGKGGSRHTPGPWVAVKSLVANQIAFSRDGVAPSNYRIGISAVGAAWLPEHAEANARLIAAAPELLAALKQCVALIPEREWVALRFAADAIAKAEGQS